MHRSHKSAEVGSIPTGSTWFSSSVEESKALLMPRSVVRIHPESLGINYPHRVWLNNCCGHARSKAEVEQAVVAAKEYRETGAL